MNDQIDPQLKTSDFDYDLPAELIAQVPIAQRDASRLLVLDRSSGGLDHRLFTDLPDLLDPGDLVVANNTRVFRGRMMGRREPSGGYMELLLLRQISERLWTCLARPARRLHVADQLVFESPVDPCLDPIHATVRERQADGTVSIEFASEQSLEQFGVMPLPPYIHEPLEDDSRYQTIYAQTPGSAAAPTAGLHMTNSVKQGLSERDIGWTEVTLHVGLDTFRPVAVDQVAAHEIHTEWCAVPPDAVRAIVQTQHQGKRIVALGTTAARTLETAGQRWRDEQPSAFEANTDLFITPGYEWTVVDAVLTNFHLPRSTLLMMVGAFAGRDNILAAYRTAIEHRYRFYSFGDAMLIR